jgi:cytochrome c oxidase subunit 3
MDQAELRMPYGTTAQQHDAAMMGMYVFLASEIMLFGGLFAVIFYCRVTHAADVVAISKQFHLWLATINTALLITSSLAVASAVTFVRAGRSRGAALFLAAAIVLGLAFLVVKGIEYGEEYGEGLLPGFADVAPLHGPARLFTDIYFVATSLHALHLAIGIVLLAVIAYRLAYRTLPRQVVVSEVAGLYWHFVDVVWLFLYPALYLVR